ncbi:hypothetical protein EJ03DRAFT_322030 [Teratosphaeria nubilosa]|uniref:NADH dehydrogenase [ubiquinone] 1 alpha subcomplex subunit 1 n=1 Tax=Teratosphaeria nubilosa TaxID=161662 RepID=A0A6G1KTI2_9PEZI|nr:hypothetical protein EJ03DRAFT_322030 [Teratosphaeria nubilosa]
MGVPFEALIPYGIMLAFFGVSGAGLSKLRHMQNGGKRGRHSVDQWDRQMMERDRRLTGFLRGQTDNVRAPPGFELSHPWKVSGVVAERGGQCADQSEAREGDYVMLRLRIQCHETFHVCVIF